MSALVTLWALATIDGAFAGWNAVAGRDARIHKPWIYGDAMRAGALAAQLAAGATALLALAFVGTGTLPFATLEAAARAMLLVYVPYAALLGLAALARH